MPRLPIFPLPLVLFPGATLPLHIFEPRYRQLLEDCLGDGSPFGIACQPHGNADVASLVGMVGCVARIVRSDILPDGRSNIVVEGTQRFVVRRIVPTDRAYHVGDVDGYDDDAEPADAAADLVRLAGRVRPLFLRVAAAARAIANERVEGPHLPDDSALLSFAIAGLIDLDLDTRQQMLASRSALARLRELERLLGSAAPVIESRASVHRRAGQNGHGPHPQA